MARFHSTVTAAKQSLRIFLLAWLCAGPLRGDEPGEKPLPIRTFIESRSLGHPQLLPFLTAARPQVVQIGNYGAMFHGYADNPKSVGWPMNLPVAGERAALEFQRKLNAEVHKLGLKVVGHFRLVKVMGDWERQDGFVTYYNDRWPEDLLGPKPHPHLTELLQRDAGGKPIQTGRYEQAQLALCLSSPHARALFKQMLKVALDQDIDGVITTFNYRLDCACPYCQSAFKAWLGERLTAAELKAKLQIADLAAHQFETLPSAIPGYPDADTVTELEWQARQWGAEHFKRMYDEIFLAFGRSLKPDLLVAQWNHLGHVGLSEERAFLPEEMWGRGEDYFWYSGGASFVGESLNLTKGKAGDAWLSSLYVRELAGHKPFVMGKYEPVRMAVSMAEGYATGGMGMGRYQKFEDPVGFEVLARYTNFMHRHRDLYDGAEPYADAALVLPRQTVLNRRPEGLAVFREVGQALVERQVLLDVVADQNLSAKRLARYPAVILPHTQVLSTGQLTALRQYAEGGGTLIALGEVGDMNELGQPRLAAGIANAVSIAGEDRVAAAEAIVAKLRERGSSAIESPWTVRVAAYEQPGRVSLHLVNYNRDESPVERKLNGPAAERPIAAENIAVKLRLPVGRAARDVVLRTPDQAEELSLRFEQAGEQITFTVPSVLVYGVVAVTLGEGGTNKNGLE